MPSVGPRRRHWINVVLSMPGRQSCRPAWAAVRAISANGDSDQTFAARIVVDKKGDAVAVCVPEEAFGANVYASRYK